MTQFYRNLAPITGAAWEMINEEASRTLKRYLGARQVVDMEGPKGFDFAAVATGHDEKIASDDKAVAVTQRTVMPMVELRVPFRLSRKELDDVSRGSQDPDLQPLKDAANKIATMEDRIVFQGYKAAKIPGMIQSSSNSALTLGKDIKKWPAMVAKAMNDLKLAGVNGPYQLVLSPQAYTDVMGGSDDGYPVLKHIARMLDSEVVWSPALTGGILMSKRGGDFQLTIGQDISIGYKSHTADEIELYFIETLSYLTLTTEASVTLKA